MPNHTFVILGAATVDPEGAIGPLLLQAVKMAPQGQMIFRPGVDLQREVRGLIALVVKRGSYDPCCGKAVLQRLVDAFSPERIESSRIISDSRPA